MAVIFDLMRNLFLSSMKNISQIFCHVIMIGKEPVSTFKDIRPEGSRAELNAVDIVFVHGLEAKKLTALLRSLKEWLLELSKTTNGHIWMFGFDAGELLTEGNERFIRLADELYKNIQPLRGAGRFLFIGHDFAGWIVEETLARYTAAEVAWNTAGVIFLGLPPVDNEPNWAEFSKGFLDRYSNTKRRKCTLELFLLQRANAKFKSLNGSPYEPNVYSVPIALPPMYNTPLKVSAKPKWQRGFGLDPPTKFQQHISRRHTAHPESSTDAHPVSNEETEQQVYLLNIKPTDSMHKEVVSFVLKAMAHEKREPRFELPRVHLVDLHNDSRRTSTHIQHQYSSHSLETSSPRTTRSFASIRLDSEVSFSGNVSSLDQLVDMGIVDVQGDSRLPRRRIEDVQQNFSTKPGEENDFERQVKNNRELQESQVKVVAYLCDSPVNDAKALLRLAALYQQSGELQKSKSIYKRAKTIIERELSIDPAGIDYIRCQLAIIDLLEGRFREAEKTFAELEMKLHSTFGDHERTWEVMRWHALAFDVQGQYQKALPKLQQIPVPMEIEISEPFTQATNVTLLTQSTLALVMAHVGEYRRAIEYSGLALSHAEALCARPAIANVKIWTGTDDNEESACIGRMLSAIQSDRANILANVGQYIEAQSINDQAMKGMERYYGSKYVATLECWSLKVHLLALEGKIDEAEQQCQTTLRAMRRDIGKEHPSTLRTLGILVFIYRSQAKWADALQNATYLVDRNRSSHDIGPQHPQTISSMAQLADVYLACGQLVQALSDQITIVGLSEQVLGKDHPITLNYRSDLANIYCNLENWNSAREILFEVFVKQMEQVTQFVTYVRRSHNGETQPLNMSSIKEVCEIFRALRSKGKNYNDIPLLLMSTMHRLGVSERDREDGNLEFARELLEQVVEYREIRLGLDHADTLSSQLDLAMTKRQLSCHQNSTVDLEKLLEVFNRIAHVRQERLGSDHPDTLSARRERSLTKIQLGLIAKAVDEQEEILRSCIRLLGNGHPNTIRSCTDLSIAYHSIGDLKRAETLQLDALKAQLVLYPSPILKEEARKTFNAALEALGLATKGQAETTEADTKNLELSDSEPLALPETPYHPRITSSMACLASIYTEQENFPLAALVQEAVVSQHKLALPDSIYSLTTLESINTLAALNQAQRNYFRAITLYNEVLANAPAHSPLYFASQSFLGSLYFSQDDFANAERVQKKAYEEQCAIAESDADSEARSKNEEALVIASFNLALTKWELGKKGEAKVLMGVARVFAERGLGGEHERTREVVDTLREWEAEDLE